MEKQNVLNRLSAGLKHERLAYKICGIVLLVTSIIFILIGTITTACGIAFSANEASANESYIISNDDSSVEFNDDGIIIEDDDNSVIFDGDGLYIEDGETSFEITASSAATAAGVGVAMVGGFYFGLGAVLLAVAIVDLVMASKVGKYRFSEVLTVKHASSVGSIVVAALFNEIALIFVIINFVFAKKNRALLEN